MPVPTSRKVPAKTQCKHSLPERDMMLMRLRELVITSDLTLQIELGGYTLSCMQWLHTDMWLEHVVADCPT